MTYDMFRIEFVNQFPDKEAVFADVLKVLSEKAESLFSTLHKKYSPAAQEESATLATPWGDIVGVPLKAEVTYCSKASASVESTLTEQGLVVGLQLNTVASRYSLDYEAFKALVSRFFLDEAFCLILEKGCVSIIESGLSSFAEEVQVTFKLTDGDYEEDIPWEQGPPLSASIVRSNAQVLKTLSHEGDSIRLKCTATLQLVLAFERISRSTPLLASETTVPPAPEPVVQSPRSLPSCADCRAGTCAIHGTSPLA